MESGRLTIGEFELDVGAYELRRGGRIVKLERLPMELLMLLIEHREHVVARSDIVEKLWGKDVFVDVDNSINTAIRKLRTAFHDNPARPAFIKTFPGKGYRFIAPVSVVQTSPAASQPVPDGADRRIMLAVLPFENLSADPEQQYFSDGLTEETICHLGQMSPQRMGVIARTSSMAYKGTTKSILQIGRELGVDYVLESSVRREGARVRITSQLIRVEDQTHLWAETYDRDGPSFLGIQDELGKAIARQVQIQLNRQPGGPARGQTTNADAYDLYLRGRYYWNLLTPAGIQRGLEYFQQAIVRDPGYALAYAGLAECYAVLPITCDAPALEALPRAQRAADRAIELDGHLADAYAARGSIKMWMEWDWVGAELALRRSVELNPDGVTVHRWYGHLLADLGRHKESAAEMAKARRMDPLSPMIHGLSGQLSYLARDYDSALNHVRNALAINANLWVIHTFLGKIYERKGMLEEALQAFQTAFDLSGGNTEQISLKAYVHAKLGHRGEAEHAIRILTELARQRYVPPYNVAMIFAGLCEVDRALESLEEAYKTRDVRMTFLATEPKWDFMRSHPRFQDLLLRMALPSSAVTWQLQAGEA